MMIITLGLHANTLYADSKFTVTQIALDTIAENEIALNQVLTSIVEDQNISNEGGDSKNK